MLTKSYNNNWKDFCQNSQEECILLSTVPNIIDKKCPFFHILKKYSMFARPYIFCFGRSERVTRIIPIINKLEINHIVTII